jgi:hypothetical protein
MLRSHFQHTVYAENQRYLASMACCVHYSNEQMRPAPASSVSR